MSLIVNDVYALGKECKHSWVYKPDPAKSSPANMTIYLPKDRMADPANPPKNITVRITE